MDSVLRAAAVYLVLLLLVRISGRRTLAQMTPFDLVLLLLIGESSQQALLGEDFSVTNAILVVTTLIMIDVGLSYLKCHLPTLAKWVDGVPMVIVQDGRPLRDRMKWARVDEGDVMEAARESAGLERIDQIKYAVLEVGGHITIIPMESAKPS